jgi:hypothetical protein
LKVVGVLCVSCAGNRSSTELYIPLIRSGAIHSAVHARGSSLLIARSALPLYITPDVSCTARPITSSGQPCCACMLAQLDISTPQLPCLMCWSPSTAAPCTSLQPTAEAASRCTVEIASCLLCVSLAPGAHRGSQCGSRFHQAQRASTLFCGFGTPGLLEMAHRRAR